MSKVRILIADDHEMMRRGLRAVIESHPGWEICGEAADGRDAVEMARQLKPDVVIMDVTMPELNGMDATAEILKFAPRTHIAILTVHSSGTLLRKALEAGARSYVLKSDAGRDLVAAVEAVLQDKPFLTAAVSEVMMADYMALLPSNLREAAAKAQLTRRQVQVIELLAQGKSNKEVASALGIGVRTAEAHRMKIMHKLNLNSLSDLVRYAIRMRIADA